VYMILSYMCMCVRGACELQLHLRYEPVCVCSVWGPCVALPSGGGSSVGPSPLCGSPVWVPCAGPLCGSFVALRHAASTRVMPPARSHAPA